MAPDADVLLAEFYQPLFRYLCRAAGEAETARDLTQDVFLRVSRSPIPSASRAELQAWIFRIARNLVVDHHRRRRRGSEVDVPAPQSLPASQDVTLAVNRALATLSPLDRDVFLMREVAGLGYNEIATACDITPGGVRSRIHRARLHLRGQLAAPVARQRAVPMRLNRRND